MQQFNVSKGVKGFFRLYDYGYKYTHMITKEAQERMRILKFWKAHGLKATRDAFGVSRSALFDWQSKLRASKGKLNSLNPGSQARHHQQRREVDYRLVAEIRRLRLEVCPNMGKDKIKPLLDMFCAQHGLKYISASTIGRVIKDKKIYHHRIKVSHFGRIKQVERKKKLRKPKDFVVSRPGDLLQMDTVIRFVDRMKRYIITAVDVHSRYTFAWSYQRLDSANAQDFFRRLELVLPFRVRHVQTDNGSEFSKYFTSYLRERRTQHFWNFKSCPTQNAYVEKYNRTLQEEFVDQHERLLWEPEQFNKQLMNYILWYNTERPHWGLKLQSPVNYMLQTNILSRMRWTDTLY